jgi:sugar lactone lactonase YvrE
LWLSAFAAQGIPAAEATDPQAAPAVPRIELAEVWERASIVPPAKGWFEKLGSAMFGKRGAQFGSPVDLAIAPDGFLTLLDFDQKCLWLVDRPHQKSRLVRGPKGSDFVSPVGIALGPDGRIYVTDSFLKKICIFDRKARFVGYFASSVDFLQPVGIAYSRSGRCFWVSDSKRHVVHQLDEAGCSRQTVGRFGSGAGEFNFPGRLCVAPDGRMLVVDSLNSRVQMFAPDGSFLRAFGAAGDRPGHFARPKAVALDRAGRVYVADALFDIVQIFDPGGSVLMEFGGHGARGGEFSMPSGLFIDGEDRIHVADTYNRRIQVFRLVTGAKQP